ncbi:hypothetical protein K2P47_03220 [Patescibacteria group bacterium]|nr:hypothetical protein [Patescibacteria group bacterium]
METTTVMFWAFVLVLGLTLLSSFSDSGKSASKGCAKDDFECQYYNNELDQRDPQVWGR